MKKILPVKIDAIITSECWTYWKMAIIQTLPDYMIWLSSHLDIFQNLDSVYFGKDLKVFSNEYYSDILDIEEIKIYSISYNKIIEFIKNCINSDFYYTVFILKNLNNECNNLHILHDSNNIFHEIFIYGYDDENKVFNSISISENNYFKPTTIAYDKLKNGYLTMQKYFYYNPSQYNFKRDFSYLMSRSKVNYKYKTKDYSYDYFKKISNEAYGNRKDVSYSDIDMQFLKPFSFYSGVTCILSTAKRLSVFNEKEITPNDYSEIRNIQTILYKLYEHRLLIASSMEWYEDFWTITSDELINIRKKYLDIISNMEVICKLYLKLLQTSDKSIINKIIDKLYLQYSAEKVILNNYYINVLDWYYNNVIGPNFKKLYN